MLTSLDTYRDLLYNERHQDLLLALGQQFLALEHPNRAVQECQEVSDNFLVVQDYVLSHWGKYPDHKRLKTAALSHRWLVEGRRDFDRLPHEAGLPAARIIHHYRNCAQGRPLRVIDRLMSENESFFYDVEETKDVRDYLRWADALYPTSEGGLEFSDVIDVTCERVREWGEWSRPALSEFGGTVWGDIYYDVADQHFAGTTPHDPDLMADSLYGTILHWEAEFMGMLDRYGVNASEVEFKDYSHVRSPVTEFADALYHLAVDEISSWWYQHPVLPLDLINEINETWCDRWEAPYVGDDGFVWGAF